MENCGKMDVVVVWWCGGVFVVLWWCLCGGVFVLLSAEVMAVFQDCHQTSPKVLLK